ncbi:hypothetical protein ACVWYU_001801 [Pseudomonas sp. TE12234]
MNYWPLICVGLASITAILGFGAGAATGASFIAVDFKDLFIPMFSALGGWVSGAGALAAVGTTIYFYKKQEEANEENLEIIVYNRYDSVHVDITCLSRQPAFITDLYFHHDDQYYFLSSFDKKQLDVPISYKEKKTFELLRFQMELQRLCELNLMEHASEICVETTLDDYSADECYV